jgi:hypothetical protein
MGSVRTRHLTALTAALITVLSAGCDGAAPPAAPTRGPSPAAAGSGTSAGWQVTVYYTAVEHYHSGTPIAVTGCPQLDCTHGAADLGTYPKDFVQAVRDEGTGVTTDGRYLNWSYDTGYWLDTATRDTDGEPLEPFVSAAADPGVLADGTGFVIENCGTQDDGSEVPALICSRLRAARWTVTDEFTPGLGGRQHIDAYIGEETGPDFTASDWYITLTGATVHIG